MKDRPFVHPYIPNTEERVRRDMMDVIGIQSADQLYEDIPREARVPGPLELPPPLRSEWELKRHVEGILAKNSSCAENLSFLGGGCYRHHVPAVCSEIAGRGEFVTAYDAGYYADQGKYQAVFEYLSMMAELLETDMVSITYDGLAAASSALLMAARITGRREALVVRSVGGDKRAHMRNFCRPGLELTEVEYDRGSGLADLTDLEKKLSSRTACVYFESPTCLGVIETQGAEIAALAHAKGALCVAGVNPISLGVLETPATWGADILCGDVQPLGLHMNCGGGLCGFIATGGEPRFAAEHPSPPLSVFPEPNGDLYFGKPTKQFSSYIRREQSPDFTGSLQTLSSITAGVYLALMGPGGMYDIGRTMMERTRYAMQLLGKIPGVRTDVFSGPVFHEFAVDFNGTGRTVAEINRRLLEQGVFGGSDLSADFPELGQAALYCVTEIHAAADLERLAEAVKEALN